MKIEIFYISEAGLSGNSAYLHHTIKMCDALSNLFKTHLITPFGQKNFYKKIRKRYLLTSKRSFATIFFFNKNKKRLNFLSRLIFGFRASFFLKKNNKNKLIISRSVIASFIMSLFKIKHFLEIHHELTGMTKFLFINLKMIHSKYIINIIFISSKLKKKFQYLNLKNSKVMHDAVDIKNFKHKKFVLKKIKRVLYIGSFYNGRGIELIFDLALKNPNLEFYLYGLRNENIKRNKPKNLRIFRHVNYEMVPKIIMNSDILLMPYSKKTFINAVEINTADYCSPLKMFDYLAGAKIILSSKLSGICEILKNNYNSIIVNSEKVNPWNKKLKFIIKNKNIQRKIRLNSLVTAKNNTWETRAINYLKFYLQKN